MQFKIDENLPVEIAEMLNVARHDAKTVNDQRLQGTTDPALINICTAEDRVLVTLDTDFSDIRAYPPEQYSGIIILRLANQAKPYLIDIFKRTIPLIGKEPLKQHLWIVEEARIRIRGKDDIADTE
jgi:predicted nuclease of predicted toxin-antitoxin system